MYQKSISNAGIIDVISVTFDQKRFSKLASDAWLRIHQNCSDCDNHDRCRCSSAWERSECTRHHRNSEICNNFRRFVWNSRHFFYSRSASWRDWYSISSWTTVKAASELARHSPETSANRNVSFFLSAGILREQNDANYVNFQPVIQDCAKSLRKCMRIGRKRRKDCAKRNLDIYFRNTRLQNEVIKVEVW